MVTAELGACEWFVWDLRRSNLVERGQLEQIVGEFMAKHPRAEPPQLAQYLIEKSILTDFQAERLLAGKTQGFVLGPFTLMDALGTGSMGTVYKSQNKNDNKWYAVKVLPRRSMWNIRIAKRKVRDFENFEHPAVVPFADVGTAGGQHYLAWPLVEEGVTLEKLVLEHGRLQPGITAYYALQAAEGLETTHQHEVIHGLMKPSNLLITPNNQVKILDFGVGCLLAETENESVVDTMSTANTMASGLDCASPESVEDPKNGLTPLADQYSLGCIMYYCLTGKYPFPGASAVEKMMAQQTKQPPPIKESCPEAPDELVKVVNRMMGKKPDDRYGSMTEVVAALKPLTVGVKPPPLKMPKPVEAPAPPRVVKGDAPPAPKPQPASQPGPASGKQPASSPDIPTRDSFREPASSSEDDGEPKQIDPMMVVVLLVVALVAGVGILYLLMN